MKLVKTFALTLLFGLLCVMSTHVVMYMRKADQDCDHVDMLLPPRTLRLQQQQQLSAGKLEKASPETPRDKIDCSTVSTATASSFRPVVILTYQRTGSSFFGSLFHGDPNAFYVFEPLDGLYTSLYGTAPGWNVPSDIVSHKNGSERVMPPSEKAAVAEFLQNLLTCDVNRLPTEWLAHKFWMIPVYLTDSNSSVGARYSKCVRPIIPSGLQASRMLLSHCGRRLTDMSEESHQYCFQMLHNKSFQSWSAGPHGKFQKYQSRDRFATYARAIESVQRKLNVGCKPLFRSLCSEHKFRVVKLVRAPMAAMEPLMSAVPELRVVHLVRDPRPVSLSRKEFDASARSDYAESSTTIINQSTPNSPRNVSQLAIRESAVYCRQVVADFEARRRLERMFPGRLFSLTYEQLVDDPFAVATEVYRFIGQPLPPVVAKRFSALAAAGNGKNASAKKLAWRWTDGRISRQEFEHISENCAEMFRIYPQYANVIPRTFRTNNTDIWVPPIRGPPRRKALPRLARPARFNPVNVNQPLVKEKPSHNSRFEQFLMPINRRTPS